MNQEKGNQKILELMNKEVDLSQEEINLFKELIFQCDLKQKNNKGYTPLMYALRYNKYQNLILTVKQWDYLIKNSDLTQKDKNDWTPLLHALFYNKSENLILTVKQWDYLIKNSDLMQKDKDGWTPLMCAFIYNKEQDLNLNEEQINYLIQQSDLKYQDDDGFTPFMYALKYNKSENLKLTTKQLQTMYDALNMEQKQIAFQKLIKENVENDHQYQEKINILLYDCEFKPHEKTIHWLKKNKHQYVIQMIEKRDVFFKLNQDLKEMDNHQKIDKIKI